MMYVGSYSYPLFKQRAPSLYFSSVLLLLNVMSNIHTSYHTQKKLWITCDWYWADSASMIIFSDPSIFHLISFSLLLCVGWINHNSRLPAQACWVTFFTLQYRITSLRKLNYGAKVNILAWFHLFVWKQHLSHLKYQINSHSTTISSFKVWFSFCCSNLFVLSLLTICVFSSFFKIPFSVNMIKAEHFDLSPRLLIFYYKL